MNYWNDVLARAARTQSIIVTSNSDLCVFCFRHKSVVDFAKQEHVKSEQPECDEYLIYHGVLCSYGANHEFPKSEELKPKHPPKKVDKFLCTKCGLHRKNPASTTSSCVHEYGT